MNRHSIRATLVLAFACGAGAALVAACSDERRTFDETPRGIAPDASIDGSGCAYECSLDGRAIIDTCTGAIVETCASDLACGAGTCQEPCAAAAADRSSNGCEFYLQPPRFDKRLAQSCYASYIVNTSTGRSFSSEVVLRGNVVTGEYATGFALGLLAKDVGIAADLAEALQVDTPALELVSRRWAEAAAALGPGADHSEAHKQWWPAEADDFQSVKPR